MEIEVLPSSFRDPSGFLFKSKSTVYRQVNIQYKDNYERLFSSGLYDALTGSGLLINHEEVDVNIASTKIELAYKVIKPEQLEFISYPYEWSFSQLKDAALLTLKVQKMALEYGMSLKDCSAYNIQFRDGKPLMIDTLSFEKYSEGKPWISYRQFCQHFLAPLSLMSYCDIKLGHLLKNFIDGIPLDTASVLLPYRTYLRPSLLFHIHMHAKSQKYYADKKISADGRRIYRRSLIGMLDNLEACTKKLKWLPQGTEWAEYYDETNYTTESFEKKKELLSRYLELAKVKKLWDIGANTGLFSRVAAKKGIETISMDVDPAAVEMNYLECKKKGDRCTTPLLIDLINPSPAIGWHNRERMSLVERGPVEGVLALALIHHLAISNNVPLKMIAEFFKDICSTLIIEFVPKSDSQVQRLLSTREDIFVDYNEKNFEEEFKKHFSIETFDKISESERILYLMRKI